MKKILCILLACLMMLGLVACSSAETPQAQEEPVGFEAGFGRVDICPNSPIGMGGYGDSDTRLSGAIMDSIYATCVALRQGDTTFLVFTVDVISVNDAIARNLRGAVSDATGVPELMEAVLDLIPLDQYDNNVYLMDKTAQDKDLKVEIWDTYRDIAAKIKEVFNKN